jgi:hypothetical protein
MFNPSVSMRVKNVQNPSTKITVSNGLPWKKSDTNGSVSAMGFAMSRFNNLRDLIAPPSTDTPTYLDEFKMPNGSGRKCAHRAAKV